MANEEKDTAVKTPRVESGQAFKGELTIEVGTNRNHVTIIWKPDKRELRGRFEKQNLTPDEMSEKMAQSPEIIPGMYVQIDGSRRQLRIFDPLALPANEELLVRMKAFVKAEFSSTLHGFQKGVDYDAVSDTQIKTWLWNAHQLLVGSPVEINEKTGKRRGGPMARVVTSRGMPTDAAAREKFIMDLPGRIRVGQMAAQMTGMRYHDEKPLLEDD